MLHSMTGYASSSSQDHAYRWSWDIRSVNARGLDVRVRLPDWLEPLEFDLKRYLKTKVYRGAVTVGLKIQRLDEKMSVDISPEGLSRALTQIDLINKAAQINGVPVTPASLTDIAAMRGVIEARAESETDHTQIIVTLRSQIPAVIDQFISTRAQEGSELAQILGTQVDSIEQLVKACDSLLEPRNAQQAHSYQQAINTIICAIDPAKTVIDAHQLAQELAILAVKTDVREEIDRLNAHVAAARLYLQSTDPVGRKFEFLIQEFVREANTLCSKAQYKDLTTLGLDLKHVIDQMREQVQNVE